jgi:hypothetical protein
MKPYLLLFFVVAPAFGGAITYDIDFTTLAGTAPTSGQFPYAPSGGGVFTDACAVGVGVGGDWDGGVGAVAEKVFHRLKPVPPWVAGGTDLSSATCDAWGFSRLLKKSFDRRKRLSHPAGTA